MDNDLKDIINRTLNLVTLYLKTRIISRISLGFIAGGLSLLGFNNFMPYIAILIKPELSDKFDLANNALTILGVSMIVLGALIPVFLRIFNHYRELYLNDLKRINEVYEITDFDTFNYQMLRISNNASIFDYEIDLIEDFYNKVLATGFFFNDTKANEIVKRLGNELSNFNTEMSMRVSPSGTNSRLYNHPRHLPTFAQTAEDITTDCNRLIGSYTEMKQRFDVITNKKLMRFFK